MSSDNRQPSKTCLPKPLVFGDSAAAMIHSTGSYYVDPGTELDSSSNFIEIDYTAVGTN